METGFAGVPRHQLYSLVQSTASGYRQLYDFQVISSPLGGAAGATAVWGPVVPNGTGGWVNFYIQVASVGYSSVYAFDVLGIYKSFDKTNWFVHTVFAAAAHPNLSTASSTKQNWTYAISNMPNKYHRLQYVFRALRRATSNAAIRPHIKVRAFSEVVESL